MAERDLEQLVNRGPQSVMSLSSAIRSDGYVIVRPELPEWIREQVIQRNWVELDRCVGRETLPDGAIFRELRKYSDFSQIEFIISIRSSRIEPDEDGIWHDDGSRVLAFSLSLTLEPHKIEGGRLEIRKKALDLSQVSAKGQALLTPPFGEMIVFATGWLGFEHRIYRVIEGERIIIAGWCT